MTPPWVLYPSEIVQMGFMERLLARAVFAMSIKVLGRQPGAPNIREHELPKKMLSFEVHRTSDSSVGSAALPNHAFGLYGTFSSKSSIYKVN